MEITSKETAEIAELIKLELNEREIEEYTVYLQEMLQYTDKIKEVETNNVLPTINILTRENVYREDEPRPCLPRETALANAPEKEDGMFRVPSVIE